MAPRESRLESDATIAVDELGGSERTVKSQRAQLMDKLPDQYFNLSLDRYGYFKQQRTVWAGPSETPAPLVDLQQALMHELNVAQIPLKTTASFRPHVTLARHANQLNERPAQMMLWRVSKIMLIQSVQQSGGVIYSPVAERALV
jgi:2'-5' RNA ligase